MEQNPRSAAHADIVAHEKRAAHDHHHRGKSSESLLDKGAILAALRIPPGQTVLDAGCGNGYMSKEFAKQADAREEYTLAILMKSVLLRFAQKPQGRTLSRWSGTLRPETA